MALMFLSRRKNRRSNLNWSHVKVTDLSVGTITPIDMMNVSKGDIVSFSPSSFIQAMAMKAPLVNGFQLCLEYFFAPNRLYHGRLLLNEMDVTNDPSSVLFPSIYPSAPYISNSGSIPWFSWNDNEHTRYLVRVSNPNQAPKDDPELAEFHALSEIMVQPGSILDFLGFPVGWIPTQDVPGPAPTPADPEKDDVSFNVTKVCAYLDVILNYYANQQVDVLYTSAYASKIAYKPVNGGEGFARPLQWQPIPVQLDLLESFVNGLKRATDPSRFIRSFVNENGGDSPQTMMSWAWLCSPMSLFQRSFKPYYLESWLKTAYGDAIGNTIKVDVENGSVSFADIRAKSHYQRFLELSMAGGSRYSDYENAQFDLGNVKNYTTPIFLGSDRQFLGSRVIYQTTGFENQLSPLGSFAGQSSGGDKFRRRKIRIAEDGVFMVLATLVPDTIYYRGLNPDLKRVRLDDLYTPALDNVGMEPLPVRSLDALPPIVSQAYTGAGNPNQSVIELGADVAGSAFDQSRAVGFVPAWSDTMQQISRIHGSLQGDLKYWVLARDYSGFGLDGWIQQSVDGMLERFLKKYYEEDGYIPSRGEALRIFFDNLRQNSHYEPYILNYMYNYPFADTSPSAKNFVLTLSLDMTVNREKSKVNIPNTL